MWNGLTRQIDNAEMLFNELGMPDDASKIQENIWNIQWKIQATIDCLLMAIAYEVSSANEKNRWNALVRSLNKLLQDSNT